MYVSFSSHQPVLQHSSSWVFNNSIQFYSDTNYLELAQTPQVKGSAHKAGLSSDASHQSWPPVLLIDRLEVRAPHNLLLRNTFYYYFWFIIKLTTQKQPSGRDA